MDKSRASSRAAKVDFSDPRVQAFGVFLESYIKLTTVLEADLQSRFGLSLSEVEVLIELARDPESPMRPRDLVEHCALTSSSCTRLVQRLERQGLTSRTPSATDRRGQDIAITNRGSAILASLLPGHFDMLEANFWGVLGAGELASLERILTKVMNAVDMT